MKSISYELYVNRLLGGWYGKSIGGVIATQVEGVREAMDFREDQVWPEKHPANDDLTMQVMFLEALEEHGVYFTQRDLVETWIERCWYPFGEYSYFIRNYRKGILPPVSPEFDNPIKEHGMGAPIRSEIWAMVCPGDPELARALARLDGTIDHSAQSVAGEEMWAGLESELFFERDFSNLRKLIEKHRKCLPRGSKIARSVELALSFHDQGLDIAEARRRILARLGEPDASDARINVAFTVLALLYGRGDFKKTALLAMNLGYDTDCTAATALAILGMIRGLTGLPQDWVEKNGPNYVCDLLLRTRDDTDLRHVAERTARAGLAMTMSRSAKCRITDVPEGARPISMTPPSPGVKLEWDYRGMPSMAIGDSRRMTLVIRNETGKRISGKLKAAGPAGWKVEPDAESVAVKPRGILRVPVRIEVPAILRHISQTNSIKATLTPRGGRPVRNSFGISGACPWQALGLFFDSYDRVKHPEVTWDKGRWPKMYPGGMSGHYFADLNVPYVKEGDFDYKALVADARALLGETATIHAHTMEIPADDVTRLTGEFCVYLLANVISETETPVEMGLGSNDALKIWINGELVHQSDGRRAFVPMDRRMAVKFRAGLNRLVIKAVRSGDSLRLAIQFRDWRGDPPRNRHWVANLKWAVE